MLPDHEIDYGTLIDRAIRDFRPAAGLWSLGARLLCWILFEAALLILAATVGGTPDLRALLHSNQFIAAGLLVSASFGAAFLALKSAIPGREVSWLQLTIVIATVAAASGLGGFGRPSAILDDAPVLMPQLFGLAALPWLCLFWAVRRGVPLRPELTGAAVGLAAFCLAATLRLIVSGPPGFTNSGAILALSCLSLTGVSAVAGQLWLNWIARWPRERATTELVNGKWLAFSSQAALPAAIIAAAAVLMLVLKGPGPRIAEFDPVIESYNRAVEGFHPNVPSNSMETMLTAYVEHGMPAYMWDFGPEGFKLTGGRWQPLADGTPLTYTWFRGSAGGVICMMRQVDAFNPPPDVREEHHDFLFYKYRGFSVCLINIGGYGNFIGVIAAPIPLQKFVPLVLRATN